MFPRFQQLLQDRNPRFTCVAAGGEEPSRHTAYIDHEITPPLDGDSLNQLRSQLSDLPHLIAFYERYGSARLYRDSVFNGGIGRASAYFLAPPDAWPELRDDAEDWFSQLDDQERADILPDWIPDYLVVGAIPNSGNYFLVPLVGDDRGKVYEFEHDGFEFIERGQNFEEFVESLADTGSEHLDRIGGHTRYCDGKTSHQWMPESYACDPSGA